MIIILEIPPEIEILFERARELRQELMREYEDCINSGEDVSLRAKCLTHEVLERIRVALDHTMRKYWDMHILNRLSEADRRKRINIYFPIRKSIDGFRQFLDNVKMNDLELIDKPMYDLLLASQPFTKEFNNWLYSLTELAGIGKHVEIIDQKQKKIYVFTVESETTRISWIPQYLKFDPFDPNVDIKMIGAPIDPYHRDLISNPNLTVRHEERTDFRLEKEDFLGEGRLSAPYFCSLVISQAYRIVKKMIKLI